MKATIQIPKEVEIKTCLLKVEPRYWEDATINDVDDEEGTLTPCRDGDLWCPEIDIDEGRIINWQQGVKADIHFKVCDAGSYYLKDSDGNTVLSIERDYVPNSLIPGKYGDYIIMQIDENGKIENWREPDISDFLDQD